MYFNLIQSWRISVSQAIRPDMIVSYFVLSLNRSWDEWVIITNRLKSAPPAHNTFIWHDLRSSRALDTLHFDLFRCFSKHSISLRGWTRSAIAWKARWQLRKFRLFNKVVYIARCVMHSEGSSAHRRSLRLESSSKTVLFLPNLTMLDALIAADSGRSIHVSSW